MVIKISGPAKNVAITGPRRLNALADFFEIAVTQFQDVPAYSLGLRAGVTAQKFNHSGLLAVSEFLADTLEQSIFQIHQLNS